MSIDVVINSVKIVRESDRKEIAVSKSTENVACFVLMADLVNDFMVADHTTEGVKDFDSRKEGISSVSRIED